MGKKGKGLFSPLSWEREKRKIKSVVSVHFLRLVLLFDEHKNLESKVISDLLLGPPYKWRPGEGKNSP